jgi:hypothetical protein
MSPSLDGAPGSPAPSSAFSGGRSASSRSSASQLGSAGGASPVSDAWTAWISSLSRSAERSARSAQAPSQRSSPSRIRLSRLSAWCAKSETCSSPRNAEVPLIVWNARNTVFSASTSSGWVSRFSSAASAPSRYSRLSSTKSPSSSRSDSNGTGSAAACGGVVTAVAADGAANRSAVGGRPAFAARRSCTCTASSAIPIRRPASSNASPRTAVPGAPIWRAASSTSVIAIGGRVAVEAARCSRSRSSSAPAPSSASSWIWSAATSSRETGSNRGSGATAACPAWRRAAVFCRGAVKSVRCEGLGSGAAAACDRRAGTGEGAVAPCRRSRRQDGCPTGLIRCRDVLRIGRNRRDLSRKSLCSRHSTEGGRRPAQISSARRSIAFADWKTVAFAS